MFWNRENRGDQFLTGCEAGNTFVPAERVNGNLTLGCMVQMVWFPGFDGRAVLDHVEVL